MPRVNFVAKAAKDHPEIGVAKGESYYYWTFKNRHGSGTMVKSKTRPKPSQLTRSEYMSQALALQERVEALSASSDLPSEVEDIVSELRSLADEEQSKFDNMPEGLQQGDTGQLIETRAQNTNDYADELEGIDLSDFEGNVTDGECDECSGTGVKAGEECGTCGGEGTVPLDDPKNDEGQTEDEYWQEKLEEVQNASFNIE